MRNNIQLHLEVSDEALKYLSGDFDDFKEELRDMHEYEREQMRNRTRYLNKHNRYPKK